MYMCDQCGWSTKWQKCFNRHIDHVHLHMPRPKPHRCAVCGYMAESAWRLNGHMTVHTKERRFVCEICGKAMATSARLKQHKFCVHEGGREVRVHNRTVLKYHCTQCEYKTNLDATLERHVAQVHIRRKTCVCVECDQSFWTKKDLSKHKYKYHDTRLEKKEKKFACTLCSKAFAYIGQLEAHVKIVHSEKRIECSICKKKFVNNGNLTNHMLKTHKTRQINGCANASNSSNNVVVVENIEQKEDTDMYDDFDLLENQEMQENRPENVIGANVTVEPVVVHQSTYYVSQLDANFPALDSNALFHL